MSLLSTTVLWNCKCFTSLDPECGFRNQRFESNKRREGMTELSSIDKCVDKVSLIRKHYSSKSCHYKRHLLLPSTKGLLSGVGTRGPKKVVLREPPQFVNTHPDDHSDFRLHYDPQTKSTPTSLIPSLPRGKSFWPHFFPLKCWGTLRVDDSPGLPGSLSTTWTTAYAHQGPLWRTRTTGHHGPSSPDGVTGYSPLHPVSTKELGTSLPRTLTTCRISDGRVVLRV